MLADNARQREVPYFVNSAKISPAIWFGLGLLDLPSGDVSAIFINTLEQIQGRSLLPSCALARQVLQLKPNQVISTLAATAKRRGL